MKASSSSKASRRIGTPPRGSSSCSAVLMKRTVVFVPDRPVSRGWQIRENPNPVSYGGLFWRAAYVIEPPKSRIPELLRRAPARRRNCHESRNSPELSYDYGRDDRRDRVPDPLHLGQGRRQAEPRYRPQVAPGLDRRLAAAARPGWPRVAFPAEVFGLPQESLRGFGPPAFRQ